MSQTQTTSTVTLRDQQLVADCMLGLTANAVNQVWCALRCFVNNIEPGGQAEGDPVLRSKCGALSHLAVVERDLTRVIDLIYTDAFARSLPGIQHFATNIKAVIGDLVELKEAVGAFPMEQLGTPNDPSVGLVIQIRVFLWSIAGHQQEFHRSMVGNIATNAMELMQRYRTTLDSEGE